MMSVNSAVIRFIYPRGELGRGMGMNVLVVATAFAVGPTAASLILSVGTWPLLFAINVPLGIFAFVVGIRMLPATPRGKYRFDIILAALNAGAFGFLVLGLSGAAHGDPVKIAISEVILELMFGALLLRRQARHAAPMLPVDLFKIPIFTLSALTAVCSFATQGLAFVALPFYLEQVLGRSQIDTGFLITPWPIMVALMANLAGRLSDRYSAACWAAWALPRCASAWPCWHCCQPIPAALTSSGAWPSAASASASSSPQPEAAHGKRPAQPRRRGERHCHRRAADGPNPRRLLGRPVLLPHRRSRPRFWPWPRRRLRRRCQRGQLRPRSGAAQSRGRRRSGGANKA